MTHQLVTPIASSVMAAQDEERWQAVIMRSVGTDILYAVTTTGVYCRPGCPARTPLRAHVRFFATAAQARESGFRACKRCHPDIP